MDNQWHREYLKRRYDSRLPIALQLKGGRCAKCGSTDRLQFDHVDPKSKIAGITDIIAQWSWERILTELAKCQLLCFPCHIEKSNHDGSPRFISGTAR